MATVTERPNTATAASQDVGWTWTAADLLDLLGPIPLWRVRFGPSPGAATEQDVLEIYAKEKRLCELVDGILVEKTVGFQESYLAVFLAHLIFDFLKDNDLGTVLGADGIARLAPGLLRIPDVSFIRWERLPGRFIPKEPFVVFAPDLAVEVLSPSNTAREMSRKLSDYFATGVRLVWYVDPDKRTVAVFRSLDAPTILRAADTLDGGDVLPGFTLPLSRLFGDLAPKG